MKVFMSKSFLIFLRLVLKRRLNFSRGKIQRCERLLFRSSTLAHFRSHRDLLIARPPGYKRNGKLTRNGCTTKSLDDRVYPSRTKDGSIAHAFCNNTSLQKLSFSAPSIALCLIPRVRERMVNFVQTWQRMSTDLPDNRGTAFVLK